MHWENNIGANIMMEADEEVFKRYLDQSLGTKVSTQNLLSFIY